MTTDKLPTGLLLHIGRENSPTWKEPCEYCDKGVAEVKTHEYYDPDHTPLDQWEEPIACGNCHGSGEVECYIKGVVVIDEQMYQTSVGSPVFRLFLIQTMPNIWQYQSYESLMDVRRVAIKSIVEAFRAGTLPPALLQSPENPWGLHKVRIEGESI